MYITINAYKAKKRSKIKMTNTFTLAGVQFSSSHHIIRVLATPVTSVSRDELHIIREIVLRNIHRNFKLIRKSSGLIRPYYYLFFNGSDTYSLDISKKGSMALKLVDSASAKVGSKELSYIFLALIED